MAEATKQPEGSLLSVKVPRRALLQAIGGAFLPKQSAPPHVVVQTETPIPDNIEQLKTEIGKRWGFVFSKEPGWKYDWIESSLKQIDAMIPFFPEVFYKPDADGRILNLQVAPTRGACCTYTPDQRVVTISAAAQGQPLALSVEMGHEFTHLMTEKPVFNDNGYIMENPTAKVVEEILGMPFDKFQVKMMPIVEKKDEEFHSQSTFVKDFRYALGSVAEFQAVLGQNHVRGIAHFNEAYGMFLPDSPETIEGLHSYIRETVFGGRDYPIPLYQEAGLT